MAYDTSQAQKITENEELINWLNHNISDYMVTLTSSGPTAEDSEHIGKLFHVITDLERVGDHAVNIRLRIINCPMRKRLSCIYLKTLLTGLHFRHRIITCSVFVKKGATQRQALCLQRFFRTSSVLAIIPTISLGPHVRIRI